MPDSEKPKKPRRGTPRSKRKTETNDGPEHPPESQPPDSKEEKAPANQPMEQAQQAAEAVHPGSGLLEADMLVADMQRGNGTGHAYDGSVSGLLQNHEFMERMVNEMIEGGVIDGLLDDIVDKLQDALQENEDFKRQLLQAVAAHGGFRAKLIEALIKNF